MDTIAYKVDRLTRSLADFAKIVERLDARGASFVSITQAFNTTTSMGRLMLNVLLSFAQFEREVTGERIRDKIKASKQKGMWMGGVPPLGHDPPAGEADRALLVNEVQAEQVRFMFRRYLELGSVHALRDELAAGNVRSKSWTTREGRQVGGAHFSRGALFHLLKNRVYLGEITHRGEVYPGLHPAIVDAEQFTAVNASLQANARRRGERNARACDRSPLAGLIFDAAARPMSPTAAYGARGKRYRYYVTTDLQQGALDSLAPAIRRLPAPAIENLVAGRLRRLFAADGLDWKALHGRLARVEIKAASTHILVRYPEDEAEPLLLLLSRLAKEDALIREGECLRLVAAVRPVFRGGRTWLVAPDGQDTMAAAGGDPAILTALWRAHRELAATCSGPATPDDDLARATSPADSYRRRVAKLAFLAPDIQRALLDGRQPAGLTLQTLLEADLPLSWDAQRDALGFKLAAQDLAA